jgi:hypothetical protein
LQLCRVLRDVRTIEDKGPGNVGSSSTGWDLIDFFDSCGSSFSDQSAKRLEGSEWSRHVLSGQIVRGFSARDDAERAWSIATRKKSAVSDEHDGKTSDWFARSKAGS